MNLTKIIDVIRVGGALVEPVYRWIASPTRENKQAVLDSLDTFREREHAKAIEAIRKKYSR